MTADSMLEIEAIIFDLGGTLDGDSHWLNRFYRLYTELKLPVSWEDVRRAFDFAEDHAAHDPRSPDAGVDEMLRRHVGAQLTALAISDSALEHELARRFTAELRAAAERNRRLLQELATSFRLGVISNGCGNTEVLCRELGFAPVLEFVFDSRQIGLSKPDPRFFARALDQLTLPAARVLMVGDSLERDIRPAKAVGMHTAWFNNDASAHDEAADFRISQLTQLRQIVLRDAPA